MWLRTDGAKKKLSRVLIDSKVPADERKDILVLAEGSHIYGFRSLQDAVHIITLMKILKKCFVRAFIRERRK